MRNLIFLIYLSLVLYLFNLISIVLHFIIILFSFLFIYSIYLIIFYRLCSPPHTCLSFVHLAATGWIYRLSVRGYVRLKHWLWLSIAPSLTRWPHNVMFVCSEALIETLMSFVIRVSAPSNKFIWVSCCSWIDLSAVVDRVSVLKDTPSPQRGSQWLNPTHQTL